MFNVNFQELNRISERIPNLFIDRCKIFCKHNNVYVYGEFGKVQLPLQKILSITIGSHATISSASLILMHNSNTHVSFAKRNGIFYYMPAIGATDKNKNSEKHAISFATSYNEIIKRQLFLRFNENFDFEEVQQARGIEGARVRKIYQYLSEKYNVRWCGRKFGDNTSKTNQFITRCNRYLYSICASVINSLGYINSLGFMHRGQMFSFTFDLADILKFNYFTELCFKHSSEMNQDEFENLLLNYVEENKILEKTKMILDYLFWDGAICDWDYSSKFL